MQWLSPKEQEIARKAGFNDMGLRFDLKELKKVDVRGKTIAELSKYVDAVTYVKTLAADKEFVSPQLREPDVNRVNVTSLGNLAFIGIRFPDPEVRLRAQQLLKTCMDHCERQPDASCTML